MLDLDNSTITYQSLRNNLIKIIISFILLTITYIIVPGFATKLSQPISSIVTIIYLVLFVIIAINLYKKTKISLSHAKQGKLIILTGILLFFFVVDPVLSEIPNKIAVFKSTKAFTVVLTALTAGICEELLFRGLLFNLCLELLSKSKYALVWTSLVSSIVFSLFHLVNVSHQPLLSTVGQMLMTLGMGMVWSYVRILCNGVTVNILLHIWQDLSVGVIAKNVGNSHINLIFPVIVVEVLVTLLCIFLYNRKYNQQFRM